MLETSQSVTDCTHTPRWTVSGQIHVACGHKWRFFISSVSSYGVSLGVYSFLCVGVLYGAMLTFVTGFDPGEELVTEAAHSVLLPSGTRDDQVREENNTALRALWLARCGVHGRHRHSVVPGREEEEGREGKKTVCGKHDRHGKHGRHGKRCKRGRHGRYGKHGGYAKGKEKLTRRRTCRVPGSTSFSWVASSVTDRGPSDSGWKRRA